MATIGLICAAIGATLLIAGTYGVRAGWWSYLIGFGSLALSLGLALAALVLLLWNIRRTDPVTLVVGLALAAAVIALPAHFVWAARGTPPIHDISTDLTDPPRFVAALARRGPGANPIVDDDTSRAAAQRRAYPDIQSLTLAIGTGDTFDRALSTARTLGWDIVAADAARGHIEAVDTTRWFGFRDDVVVRIRETAQGAIVDVRSVSRVGIGDAGANARRIRTFLANMRR